MRHFFASAIAESDVEQDSTATAAGTAGTTGITSAQTVEPPLIELEPTVSVAPPTTTHVYEPVDVIDINESVWILHSTAESTQSASYLARSSLLPRSALSATPPAAHTATLPMQSQYLHLPPPTQTVVADIHPPHASFVDTPASTTTPVPASFLLVELLTPIPTLVIDIHQARQTLTAGTVVPLHTATPYPAHCHPTPAPVTHTVPPTCIFSLYTYDTHTFAHLYWFAYRYSHLLLLHLLLCRRYTTT